MKRQMLLCISVTTRFLQLLVLEILSALRSVCNVGRFHRERYRRRLLILISLIFLCCFLYIYLFWSVPEEVVKTTNLADCLNERLKPFQSKLDHLDALILKHPDKYDDYAFFPMVGNGHFGCSLSDKSNILLHQGRSLNWPLQGVRPLISLESFSDFSQETILLDLYDAALYQSKCYKFNYLCMASSLRTYAHRTRPNLLVQDIYIHNPTRNDVSVKLVRHSMEAWSNAATKEIELSFQNSDLEEGRIAYTFYHQLVRVPRDKQERKAWIVIGQPEMPSLITVSQGQTSQYHILTAISISEPLPVDAQTEDVKGALQVLFDTVEASLKSALSLSAEALFDEHRDVWNFMWRSGLHVSSSLAPGSLNGAEINSTIYYILSHTPAPMHELNQPSNVVLQHSQALWMNDRCYDGHDTFHVKELWTAVKNEQQVEQLVSTWLLTLEKQGCGRMLKAGLDGVAQAILLSLGSLEFSGQHLEFSMHPNDLHRYFHFRGVRYDNDTWVEVLVHLDEDNRPGLFVNVKTKPNKVLYACEAVCAGGPQKITLAGLELPIRLTKPRTPLFYLSDSQQHLTDLHRAIHVFEVEDAPAHGHQLIALHRHGHALGGLPLAFWLAIALLVALFHLFLCRLVYMEYCVRGEGSVSNLPAVGSAPRYPHRYNAQRYSNQYVY